MKTKANLMTSLHFICIETSTEVRYNFTALELSKPLFIFGSFDHKTYEPFCFELQYWIIKFIRWNVILGQRRGSLSWCSPKDWIGASNENELRKNELFKVWDSSRQMFTFRLAPRHSRDQNEAWRRSSGLKTLLCASLERHFNVKIAYIFIEYILESLS